MTAVYVGECEQVTADGPSPGLVVWSDVPGGSTVRHFSPGGRPEVWLVARGRDGRSAVLPWTFASASLAARASEVLRDAIGVADELSVEAAVSEVACDHSELTELARFSRVGESRFSHCVFCNKAFEVVCARDL